MDNYSPTTGTLSINQKLLMPANNKATADYKHIVDEALYIVQTLVEKGCTYGDSWKKRGGQDSFFMLARKWDRIENIVERTENNILTAGPEIDEEILDLIGYLLLVRSHRGMEKASRRQVDELATKRGISLDEDLGKPSTPQRDGEEGAASAAYVNQD